MMKLKIIIISSIIILISGTMLLRGEISHEKFDSERWKNSDYNLEENLNIRWDMMNSLRNNHTLVGMSKSQIFHLLGKASEDKNRISYSLGYTHKGINTGLLILELDEKEVVTKVIVHQG